MEKNWFILILFVLATMVLVGVLLIKNHKDRKELFKKLPGDSPDPKMVESEFDSEET